MRDRAYYLAQASYWQGVSKQLAADALNHLWSAIKYNNPWHATKAVRFQVRAAKASALAADYMGFATMCADLAPWADRLICYGSTVSEYDGNRIALALQTAGMPA